MSTKVLNESNHHHNHADEHNGTGRFIENIGKFKACLMFIFFFLATKR